MCEFRNMKQIGKQCDVHMYPCIQKYDTNGTTVEYPCVHMLHSQILAT